MMGTRLGSFFPALAHSSDPLCNISFVFVSVSLSFVAPKIALFNMLILASCPTHMTKCKGNPPQWWKTQQPLVSI